MEAVPRLPMLSFELKTSSEATHFGPTLQKYIRTHYHEDGESYANEVKELEALRQSACKVARDFTGCSTLKRYYSQLKALQSRFPMTSDGEASVPFVWCDIYSGVAYSFNDIKYEQACILYNIGALHSELGAIDNRNSSEGMKVSCTHFQCAAWAFQHLRDEFQQPQGSDTSYELLTFYIQVMLGQAQECILEKSIQDNRKSTIISKVAVQIVDYYRHAQKMLDSSSKPDEDIIAIVDIISYKQFKSWKKFIDFKMSYYKAISHLYQGNQAEEQQKMGERLSYYQGASDTISETVKIAKNMDEGDVKEAISFTMDVISTKLNAARKENDFVYHEKVPPLDSLPELKGASLVKGIPFDPTDPEVSGTDIFSRLVPMEAHETSSLYSEEKAKLLRSVTQKIEMQNHNLTVFLSSLQLEQLNLVENMAQNVMPQELVERCAALSVRPNLVSDLVDAMQALSGICTDVDSDLKDIGEIVQEEDQKEKDYQSIIGKRAPSILSMELKKEMSKYVEAHERASESNATLHKALSIHIQNLKELASPLDQLHQSLPSLDKQSYDENCAVEMKRLMSKVEEMKQQRSMLECQLREQMQNDDITKRVVAAGKDADIQALFDQELKKYGNQILLLEQNMAAQENILMALTEANAKFANVRKITLDISLRRDSKIQSLLASFDAYEDLLEKTKKGTEFYRKLQGNVSKLLTRIKSVCKVQDEERIQILGSKKVKDSNIAAANTSTTPKLKDYLAYGAGKKKNIASDFKDPNLSTPSMGLRPSPVGAELTSVSTTCQSYNYGQYASAIPPTAVPSVASSALTSGMYSSSRPQHFAPPSSAMGVAPNSSAIPSNYSTASPSAYPQQQMPNTYTKSDEVKHHSTASPQRMPNTNPVNYIQQPQYMPQVSANVGNYQYAHQYGSPHSQQNLASTIAPSLPSTKSDPFNGNQKPYSYQSQPGASTSLVSSSSSFMNDPRIDPRLAYQHSESISGYQSAPNNVYQQIPQSPGTAHHQSYLTSPLNTSSTNSTSVHQHPLTVASRLPSQPLSYQQTSQINPQQGYETTMSPSPQAGQQRVAIPSTTLPNSQHQNNHHVYPHSSYQQNSPQSYQQSPTNQAYSGFQQNLYRSSSSVASYSPVSTMGYSSTSQQPQSSVPIQSTAGTYNQAYHQNISSAYSNQTGIAYTQPSGNYNPGYQPQVQQTYNQSYGTQQYSNINSNTLPSQNIPGSNSYQQGNFSQPSSIQQLNQMAYSSQNSNYIPPSDSNSPQMNQFLTQPLQPQTCPVNPVKKQETDSSQSVRAAESASSGSVQSTPGPSPGPSPSHQGTKSPPINVPAVKQNLQVEPKKLSSGSDLLSSTPENKKESPANVLEPKVLTIEDIRLQKEELDRSSSPKDPYTDSEVLNKFTNDVKRYEKFVEGLTKPTLMGQTPLNQKWEELTMSQDKESRKLSISVARCYPIKNRNQDLMPYDQNRVEIKSLKDDYINASYLTGISETSPKYIITQAPLSVTYTDFWTMAWEQQTEIIVCLLSDAELKGQIYWPNVRGQVNGHGPVKLSLQSTKNKPYCVERMINVTHQQSNISRVVIHLQLTCWPSSGLPESPIHLLQFISDMHSYHRQQRSLLRPIIVHCSGGSGRSGILCLLCGAVQDINCGRGIPDVLASVLKMSMQRKYIIHDKEQLRFCYEAVLYHARDLLLKRGILTSFENKSATSDTNRHVRHPSQDFILGSGNLATIQSKLGFDVPASPAKSEAKTNDHKGQLNPQSQPPETSPITKEAPTNETVEPVLEKPKEEKKAMSSESSSCELSNLMDPNTFSLDGSALSAKRKISKEDFSSPRKGSFQDINLNPNDPLNCLDPLWTVKK